MREPAAVEIAGINLMKHPAVRAWNVLRPECRAPESIAILKQEIKSAIYRLDGVGPGGAAVVAKRCLTATALTELAIYEEVLPHLPMPSLRCHGFVADQDSRFRWLFVEDAGEEPFSPLQAGHRALAASWLGLLHTSAATVPAAARLPDRGPGHYLEHLRLARDDILRNFGNPALTAGHRATLKSILSEFDSLEPGWDRIEGLCDGMPRTLVHGDLNEKNIRIRATPAGAVLLPFDWETAGWGVPAADLVKCPDTVLYGSLVREHWPTVRHEEVQRMANAGTIFRSIAAIHWETPHLDYEWVEWPVRRMRGYRTKLTNALRRARVIGGAGRKVPKNLNRRQGGRSRSLTWRRL